MSKWPFATSVVYSYYYSTEIRLIELSIYYNKSDISNNVLVLYYERPKNTSANISLSQWHTITPVEVHFNAHCILIFFFFFWFRRILNFQLSGFGEIIHDII